MTRLEDIQQRAKATANSQRQEFEDRRWLLGVVEKLAGSLRVLVAVLDDDDADVEDRRPYHGARKRVDDALALLAEIEEPQ